MDRFARNVSLVGVCVCVCLWMQLWMACDGALFYFDCTTEQETFRIVKKGLCLMNGIVELHIKGLRVLKGYPLQGM